MMVKFLLLLLIGYNAYNIHSLKVYENSATLFGPRPKIGPQLHLIDNENGDDVKWENGLTICLRFNFKKFPKAIFYIGDPHTETFIGIKLVSVVSNLLVAYADDNSSFEIKASLSVYRWHHLCLEINPSESKASLVLVSQNMSSYCNCI